MNRIRIWDGTVLSAPTLDEAVKVAKEALRAWMEEEDRIVSYNTDAGLHLLVTSYGEDTDACALIDEVSK